MELRDTLRSLADLVLDVEQHEALAQLDEDEYVRRLEAMRRDIEKGRQDGAGKRGTKRDPALAER